MPRCEEVRRRHTAETRDASREGAATPDEAVQHAGQKDPLARLALRGFAGRVQYFRVTIAVVVLPSNNGSQVVRCDTNAAVVTPNRLRMIGRRSLRFEGFHFRPPSALILNMRRIMSP